jgi:hypothetical protein
MQGASVSKAMRPATRRAVARHPLEANVSHTFALRHETRKDQHGEKAFVTCGCGWKCEVPLNFDYDLYIGDLFAGNQRPG